MADNTQERLDGLTYSWKKILTENDFDLIVDLIYPVGSIYMSVNSTSPSVLFGGTWEQIEDTFLLSSGPDYSNGDTGGSSDAVVVSHTHSQNPHTHTQNAHTHGTGNTTYPRFAIENGDLKTGTVKRRPDTNSNGEYYIYTDSASNKVGWTTVTGEKTATNQNTTAVNQNTGVDGTGKNMPPYLVVNVWKRTG